MPDHGDVRCRRRKIEETRLKFRFIQKIYRNIARHAAERASRDLVFIMDRQAAEESADFLRKNAPGALPLDSAESVLAYAVEKAKDVAGCICEFGVFEGRSLRRIMKLAPEREIHGFDSFEGLPEDWRPGFSRGTFSTRMPQFDSSKVHLHKGWFDATVAPFASKLTQPIALVHIDCDLYSSTRTVFQHILPHIRKGTVLLFDEYFNYPGWQEHEHLALSELIQSNALSVEFIAYNRDGQQAVAIVTNTTLPT